MNEQKPQAEWKWVPVEPTAEIIAAAAVAAWPVAKPADIELARNAARYVLMQMDLGTGATEESLAAVLATMAPAYRAMVAVAAQRAPSWSSCTAPGSDGYQRTVAVPGMPSAARDAALEEAAMLCDSRFGDGDDGGDPYLDGALAEDRHLATAIRALKSVAGPVASDRSFICQSDRKLIERTIVGLRDGWASRASADGILTMLSQIPAPVQQAAPSGWKLVPVEPTHIMIGAGARAMLNADSATQVDSLALTRVAYPAMLAAAPAQPAGLSEQAAFEKWSSETWKYNLKPARTESCDTYMEGETETAWMGWKARAALGVPAGLSEQDKLDAARLDALYQAMCVKPFIAPIASKEKWLASVDAAILAAKEAP